MAESHKLDYFCFCFLVAGHSKFAPDYLVILIANVYTRKDIFTDIIEDGYPWMEKCIVCVQKKCTVFSSSAATTKL